MSEDMLDTTEAARRLGLARSTLYTWVSKSDAGNFSLQGRSVSINYLQTGSRGQVTPLGRIDPEFMRESSRR